MSEGRERRCSNCGTSKTSDHWRKGPYDDANHYQTYLCGACDWYKRRHEVDRPQILWDATSGKHLTCHNCGMSVKQKGWRVGKDPTQGLCMPCSNHLKKHGTHRPARVSQHRCDHCAKDTKELSCGAKEGSVLCLACSNYYRRHQRDRPPELFQTSHTLKKAETSAAQEPFADTRPHAQPPASRPKRMRRPPTQDAPEKKSDKRNKPSSDGEVEEVERRARQLRWHPSILTRPGSLPVHNSVSAGSFSPISPHAEASNDPELPPDFRLLSRIEVPSSHPFLLSYDSHRVTQQDAIPETRPAPRSLPDQLFTLRSQRLRRDGDQAADQQSDNDWRRREAETRANFAESRLFERETELQRALKQLDFAEGRIRLLEEQIRSLGELPCDRDQNTG